MAKEFQKLRVNYHSIQGVWLAGDFNAHVGTLQGAPVETDYELSWLQEPFTNGFCHCYSRDSKHDLRGRILLKHMRELNLFLLNGRTTLDPLGEFTYDACNAKSVLDLVFTDKLLNARC